MYSIVGEHIDTCMYIHDFLSFSLSALSVAFSKPCLPFSLSLCVCLCLCSIGEVIAKEGRYVQGLHILAKGTDLNIQILKTIQNLEFKRSKLKFETLNRQFQNTWRWFESLERQVHRSFTPTDVGSGVCDDDIGQARVVMFGGTLEAGSLDEGTHIWYHW